MSFGFNCERNEIGVKVAFSFSFFLNKEKKISSSQKMERNRISLFSHVYIYIR